MSATPARIGFILEPFRRAIAENDTVLDQFGAIARKSDDPVETFFDNVADADLMAEERLALLSANRRRFALQLAGAQDIMALNYSGNLPVVQYVDEERSVDRQMLVSEIIIDLGKNAAALTVWG